jgi:predicted MFS family arabinose efflux permease
MTVAASLGLAAVVLATPWAVRGAWSAYAVFFFAAVLTAARAAPFQTLLSELVPERRRGSLMSLSMATGQAGWGAGAVLAAPAFARWGYESNALAAAAAALAWRCWWGAGSPRPPRRRPSPGGLRAATLSQFRERG